MDFRTGSFSGTTDRKGTVRKVLTHPCIIMSELGILLMFTGWKLPAPVTDAVDYIGNCNTAFSMMAVGMILADINVNGFLGPDCGKVYVSQACGDSGSGVRSL